MRRGEEGKKGYRNTTYLILKGISLRLDGNTLESGVIPGTTEELIDMAAEMDHVRRGLGDGSILMVLSSAEKLKENNILLVRELTAAGYRLIILTINHPSPILKNLYKKCDIDSTDVYFIDAITKHAIGEFPPDLDHAIFIDWPGNIKDIGAGVVELLKENPKEKTCVLIDSINTMLIYLSPEQVSQFIHFVTSRLRLLHNSAVLLAVEGGLGEPMMTQMVSFSDEVISFDGHH
jgi:hypothetical protein